MVLGVQTRNLERLQQKKERNLKQCALHSGVKWWWPFVLFWAWFLCCVLPFIWLVCFGWSRPLWIWPVDPKKQMSRNGIWTKNLWIERSSSIWNRTESRNLKRLKQCPLHSGAKLWTYWLYLPWFLRDLIILSLIGMFWKVQFMYFEKDQLTLKKIWSWMGFEPRTFECQQLVQHLDHWTINLLHRWHDLDRSFQSIWQYLLTFR